MNSELSEFQQRACAVVVVKMLGGTSFSICDLDAIGKTMGRQSALAGRDYEALRAVHCVAWADMGPELSLMVREKCLEMLGLPPHTIEALTPARRAEPAHEPASRLRLAFWRK
jgi:hypothetical protein